MSKFKSNCTTYSFNSNVLWWKKAHTTSAVLLSRSYVWLLWTSVSPFHHTGISGFLDCRYHSVDVLCMLQNGPLSVFLLQHKVDTWAISINQNIRSIKYQKSINLQFIDQSIIQIQGDVDLTLLLNDDSFKHRLRAIMYHPYSWTDYCLK